MCASSFLWNVVEEKEVVGERRMGGQFLTNTLSGCGEQAGLNGLSIRP